MNGVREEYSIKVKQTSKGIWYCDGLQVISEITTGLANELNHIMTQVEGVLKEHNEDEAVIELDPWQKAAKKVAEEKKKKPVDVTPKTLKAIQKNVRGECEKAIKEGGEK